jgi:YidC/Oxa1 family membrane protein insertase
MDTRRILLFAALAFIVYSLWTDWQKDYPFTVAAVQTEAKNKALTIPFENKSTLAPTKKYPSIVTPSSELIHIKTDVLNIAIDPKQGEIVSAQLSEYPDSLENKTKPFTLLNKLQASPYVANSHLIIAENNTVKTVNLNFTKHAPQITENASAWTITLFGTTKQGLEVKKQFIFNKKSYLIKVTYDITNKGPQPWQGYLNTDLLRQSPLEEKSSMFQVGSYTGASYSNPGQTKYKKVSFKDMTKKDLDLSAKGGWIAMQQHYFLAAWIPDNTRMYQFYTRNTGDAYTIGAVSQPITVAPNQNKNISSQLYVGPEVTSVLKSIAPGLDLTVDYGLLWILSSLIFSLMKFIFSWVGNWGWSIILVTLLIKLVFYRLSASSYKSMANMRKLQPKMQALRERFGDDKAKMSQATMELYRQEKVNPLGGCLPIIIQIPVFIALYWVLIESVELRQAPFIFWIHDLAAADPFHVLPVIMGITMLVQQKLNPTPPDPMQAKMMMLLPVFFTALFWGFPSGLVLYWIVNNVLSILQQWYITQKFGNSNEKTKPMNSTKPTKPKLITIK